MNARPHRPQLPRQRMILRGYQSCRKQRIHLHVRSAAGRCGAGTAHNYRVSKGRVKALVTRLRFLRGYRRLLTHWPQRAPSSSAFPDNR